MSRTRNKQTALVDEMSRLVRRALAGTLERIGTGVGTGGPTDYVALTVERASVPIAPARMASAHPGGESARQQARALYERCLQHYRNVIRACDVKQHGVNEVDDVGAAVACFVAANLQALCRVEGHATPEMLLRLERQLGGVMSRSSAWTSASAVDRQFYFEQMAILAVLIGETSALAVLQGPAAIANVQRAARGYLQQLLGLNPDLLTFGAEGLSLRAAHAQTEHAAPARPA